MHISPDAANDDLRDLADLPRFGCAGFVTEDLCKERPNESFILY